MITRYTPLELLDDPAFEGYDPREFCVRCGYTHESHRWIDVLDETGEVWGCSNNPGPKPAPDPEPVVYLGKHGPLAELRSALMMGA